MTTLTEIANDLKQQHSKLWDKLLNHKFISDIEMDCLPLENFIFYLQQDQLFLNEFCAFLLKARKKTTETKLRNWFDALNSSTVNYEMQMQRELLSLLGISDLDCTSVKAASATRNYIFFLRRVSSSGSLVEMVSAMSPCPWSYLEIAEKLCGRKSRIKTEVYRRWIDFYASKESRRQVEELKTILGTRYLKANRKARRLMKINFGLACRYEYRFWEMSYHRHMV